MAQLQTTIDGYRVDLDTDMDGDGTTTGCWITDRTGKYTASLAAAEDTGELTSTSYSNPIPTITIDQKVVDKITEWADASGY